MNDFIKEKYKAKAVIYDSIWMYFNSTAKDLIEDCKNMQKNIKALEAFMLSGKGIQPSQEHSIDFIPQEGNWSQAIEFLSDDKNSEYLYEVWYDGY